MAQRTEPKRTSQPPRANVEHDQDSDPPRTAVRPGEAKPGEPTSRDPNRDQDSDPPRTAKRPK